MEGLDTLPYVFSAKREDTVVCLAVLTQPRVVRESIFGVATTYLNETGDRNKDLITLEYNGFLVDREDEEAILDQSLCYFLQNSIVGDRPWQRLVVRFASPSFFQKLSKHAVSNRCSIREISRQESYFVDLDTIRSSGSDYLQSLNSNTRRQIKRAIKGYEERGPITVSYADDEETALKYFNEAGDLNRARWIEKANSSNFDNPYFVDFHRRHIVQGIVCGSVELMKISSGEKVIGYLYNFVYRGTVYFYLGGLSFEEDNKLKPGLVAHALCINQHIASGMHKYDFLAGSSQYKQSLGNSNIEMISADLQKDCLPIRIENAARRLKSFLR